MSRTLSANITAGMNGGSKPVVLIEMDGRNTTYRWSTLSTSAFPTTWTGPAFDGSRLERKGFDKIRRYCDIAYGGNCADISTFAFKVINTDLFWGSLYAASEQLENNRIEVRIIFADKTSPSWANALPLFFGFVETIEGLSIESFKIQCVDSWIFRHKTLPTRVLSKAEHGSNLPDENDGKPIPLFYGDYTRGNGVNRSGIASNKSPGSNQIIHRDYFPERLLSNIQIGNSSTYNSRGLVAGHEIHTQVVANQDTRKFIYDSDKKAFAKANIFFNFTEAFGATFANMQCNNCYSNLGKSPKMVPKTDQGNSSVGLGASYPNAVDDDDSNYTVIDANNECAAFTLYSCKLSGQQTSIRLYYYIDTTGGMVNDYVEIRLEYPTGTLLTAYNTTLADMASLLYVNVGTLSGTQDLSGLTVKFTYKDNGAHDPSEYRIYACFVAIEEPSTPPSDKFYDTGKGRKFGDWIDGADHNNAFATSQLIENPVYIIESLLCETPEGCGLTVRQKGAAIQCNDSAGSTPFFQVADAASLRITSATTIELWVYVISVVAAGTNTLLGKIDGGTFLAAPYAVRISTAGKIRFYSGNGVAEAYLEGSALPTGQWSHVVCTKDAASTGWYIYINGVLDTAGGIAATPGDTNGVLRINLSAGASTRANAIYDEIRIWNKQLTAEQVGTLYNGGNGLPTLIEAASCKAWWRFDIEGRTFADNSALAGPVTITDSSGNGNSAGSANDAQMRWRTGTGCRVNYTDSQIYEDGTVSNADHSFDQVASNKFQWKMARHTDDIAKNSRDFIRELAFEGAFAYHQRYDGRESVSRIDALGAPAILGQSKFLRKDKKPSFKWRQGKLTDVKTEFILRYRRNHATGNYDDMKFVIKPDQASYSSNYSNLSGGSGSTYWNKCKTAYTNFKIINRWEYNCDWIRDEGTAEILLKFMIDKLTRRPIFAEADCTLDTLDIEFMDVRKINDPTLPTGINSMNHFRIVGEEIDLNIWETHFLFHDVGTASFIPS